MAPVRVFLWLIALSVAVLIEMFLLVQTGCSREAPSLAIEVTHEAPANPQTSSHLIAVATTAKFLYHLVGAAR